MLWLIYGFCSPSAPTSASGSTTIIGSFTQYLGNKTFLARAWGATAATQRHRHPDVRGPGLPDDVRDDHRRADQRRDLGPGQVRRLAALRLRLVHPGLLPGRALGLGRRLHRRQARTRSTSPAARRCTSTPVRRPSPWPWCSASGSAGRGSSIKPHNVPLVALGAGLLWFGWFGFNAGSELTADGWPRRLHQHPGRHRRGAARLDPRGVDQRRQADHGRCLLRCRRRSGRHHPGLWLHRPVGGGPARPGRRCGLRAGGRPEVQARLRRLARRGRRALRRWLDRLALARPVRRTSVNPPRDWSVPPTACSTAAASTQLRPAGRRRPRDRLVVQGRLRPRLADRQDDRSSGSRPTPRSRASTRRARGERLRLPEGGGGGGAFALAGIGPARSRRRRRRAAGQRRSPVNVRRMEGLGMKLVTAVIKPYQLDAVKEALHALAWPA